MVPVSPAWTRTIVGSHRALFRATVCDTFQSGTSPTGTRIAIVDGDVTLDGTAAVRGTLDLTTLGISAQGVAMWPERADSTLVPYGNEIFIERGIQYTDDLVEYKGLGYFRIDDTGQNAPPDGPIRISGSDRMAGIVDAKLLAPRQFGSGTTLGAIVAELVGEVYPDATIEWDDASNLIALTRALVCDFDRHAFLDKLIRSIGKVWWWDYRGILVIKDLPSSTAPVWDIHAESGGVLLRVARRLTRIGVANAIVARGEALDSIDPPRGVAIDANPLSPTYFGGRFGPVPGFITSPAIQTKAQAEAAAETELRRRIGLPHNMDLTATPNPALEPYDPVSVRVPRSGRQTHVLDRIRIPLSDRAGMTAATREQTAVLITTS